MLSSASRGADLVRKKLAVPTLPQDLAQVWGKLQEDVAEVQGYTNCMKLWSQSARVRKLVWIIHASRGLSFHGNSFTNFHEHSLVYYIYIYIYIHTLTTQIERACAQEPSMGCL